MTTILVALFLIGYTAIIFEHKIKVNKAGVALCTGILCWTALFLLSEGDHHELLHHLNEELSSIAGVLLFLIGAMTIVEVMDSHDAFRFITDRIKTRSKRKLLWLIALITFFMSALLDNLTTTIVMVLLISKLIDNKRDKLFFASMIVIAANSGGAWTPMGDVTTTMLWIGGQVSTMAIITKLFLPSIVSMLVPLLVLTFLVKGTVKPPQRALQRRSLPAKIRSTVFLLGISLLVFVPVFKTITHLPPYTGMMLGVGILWIFTGVFYRKHISIGNKMSLQHALQRVDMPTILFFLGILLCIGSLQNAGILHSVAAFLDNTVVWLDNAQHNQGIIVMLIGMISAVVDNVPLVAAAQGMYDINVFPMDSFFWEFLAYAAGTGGSMLIIGSAAGVAAMGLQNINFIWYFKHITWLALLGYLAGAAVYMAEAIMIG